MTAGFDGTVRVWDGSTGTLLQTYQGWPGFLADAILTSDGLVIGGDRSGGGDRRRSFTSPPSAARGDRANG